MDNKKKNSSPEDVSSETKQGPVKTFAAGDVSASVFRHEYNGGVYYNTSFTRWYRDKNGQNRYVNSFGLDDLGNVMTVAKQSDEYIRGLLERNQ